jgi:GTP pyrophosphokinase
MSQPRTRSRALDVNWDGSDGFEFMAGIRVTGEDRPGILNDITHAILTYQNTNIRSVNIASQDSLFEGTVMVMVKHIEHLNRLLERVRKIRNVKNVERFEQTNIE